MEISVTKSVSDDLLRKAIELRMSDCFGAMNFANSIGGISLTNEWILVRKYGLDAMVEEALDRLLPISEFRSAVEKKPLTECRCYPRLRDILGGRLEFLK